MENNNKYVTVEALNRVESKIDKSISVQENLNEKFIATVGELNKTLANMDKHLALSNEKTKQSIERHDTLEAKVIGLEEKCSVTTQEITKLNTASAELKAGLRVAKWVIFTAIPVIIGLAGAIIRLL